MSLRRRKRPGSNSCPWTHRQGHATASAEPISGAHTPLRSHSPEARISFTISSGPQLARTSEHIERDWVVVLADRTASMGVRDIETPEGPRASRDEQLRAAVRSSWPMFAALACFLYWWAGR